MAPSPGARQIHGPHLPRFGIGKAAGMKPVDIGLLSFFFGRCPMDESPSAEDFVSSSEQANPRLVPIEGTVYSDQSR